MGDIYIFLFIIFVYQDSRGMCVAGYCSALKATNVCFSLAQQTIAAPLSATLTTATIMASAHIIQINFLSAGIVSLQ